MALTGQWTVLSFYVSHNAVATVYLSLCLSHSYFRQQQDEQTQPLPSPDYKVAAAATNNVAQRVAEEAANSVAQRAAEEAANNTAAASDWRIKCAEATKDGYNKAIRTGAATARITSLFSPSSSSPRGLALTARGPGNHHTTTTGRSPSLGKSLVPPIIGLGNQTPQNTSISPGSVPLSSSPRYRDQSDEVFQLRTARAEIAQSWLMVQSELTEARETLEVEMTAESEAAATIQELRLQVR